MKRPMPRPTSMMDTAKTAKTYAKAAANPRIKAAMAARKAGKPLATKGK